MEENYDLRRKIVKALNEEIGSDVKQLYKLKELYDETIAIQSNLKEKVRRYYFSLLCCCVANCFLLLQLSLISSQEPTKIQSTLKNVEDFSHQLAKLQEEYSSLKTKVPEHLSAVGSFLEKLKEQLDHVDRLELERSYLLCLKKVEDIRLIYILNIPSQVDKLIKTASFTVKNCNKVFNQIKMWKLLNCTTVSFSLTIHFRLPSAPISRLLSIRLSHSGLNCSKKS